MAIEDVPQIEKQRYDPTKDMGVISETLRILSEGKNISDQEVLATFKAIKKLNREASEKLTKPITNCAIEFLKDKGYTAEMISDTEIKVQLVGDIGGADYKLYDMLSNELYSHLQKRFPGSSAQTGGVMGGKDQVIRISYFNL